MIKARIAEATHPIVGRALAIPSTSKARSANSARKAIEARILKFPKRGSWPKSSGEFEVGSRVWLILPGRDRASAIVRWTAGHRLGAEFAEPITLEGLGD